MRTLLSALAVGLFVLVVAPHNALACHKGIPHGSETSCGKIVFITSGLYDGAFGHNGYEVLTKQLHLARRQ